MEIIYIDGCLQKVQGSMVWCGIYYKVYLYRQVRRTI